MIKRPLHAAFYTLEDCSLPTPTSDFAASEYETPKRSSAVVGCILLCLRI